MTALAALFLLLTQMAVGGPTQVQDPAYPVRVRIISRNAQARNSFVHMWGHADIVEPSAQGFDFDANCNEMIMATRGEELYSARWKKPNLELEMLLSRIGTNKSEKCTFKTDVKPYVYVVVNGKLTTRPIK